MADKYGYLPIFIRCPLRLLESRFNVIGRRVFSGNIVMDSGGAVQAPQPQPGSGPQAGVLVLCTANVCRSAMGAPLLARRLDRLGVTVPVRSAGMLGDGAPPDPAAVTVMAGYGIEIASHRSRVARPADLAQAGLVLAMARENLRYAVVTEPSAWPRAFTLKELIRRGERIGPRAPGEPFAAWLARAHDGRVRASLLGGSAGDDVPDPAGAPLRAYADTAALLDGLMARLAELGWAHAAPPP
jgi:low molecular weight protein-tyrosine phosphatase